MPGPNLQDLLTSSGRQTDSDSVSFRGDPKLGVFGQLPGIWSNTEGFEDHAWNMIALPFGTPGTLGDFRLLLNQANELLSFNLVDLGVPNRGADHQDQHLSALRYFQTIDQISAVDAASDSSGNVNSPVTPDTNDTPKGKFLPGPGVPPNTPAGIHREPGILLRIANLLGPAANPSQPGPDLARLANIPHGDAVLAMGSTGSSPTTPGAPNFTDPALTAAFDPLPIGLGSTDLSNVYFGPYKKFHDSPFNGLFDPTNPLALLSGAISDALPGATVVETTTFTVDSNVKGGIQNIPFVINEANATRVTATFWIQKVNTSAGEERFVLQYAQRVILEFFPRFDGVSGFIQWPHISINTMIREK